MKTLIDNYNKEKQQYAHNCSECNSVIIVDPETDVEVINGKYYITCPCCNYKQGIESNYLREVNCFNKYFYKKADTLNNVIDITEDAKNTEIIDDKYSKSDINIIYKNIVYKLDTSISHYDIDKCNSIDRKYCRICHVSWIKRCLYDKNSENIDILGSFIYKGRKYIVSNYSKFEEVFKKYKKLKNINIVNSYYFFIHPKYKCIYNTYKYTSGNTKDINGNYITYGEVNIMSWNPSIKVPEQLDLNDISFKDRFVQRINLPSNIRDKVKSVYINNTTMLKDDEGLFYVSSDEIKNKIDEQIKNNF